MPAVALVTSDYALNSAVDPDREIHLLADALRSRGVDCDLVDWRERNVDWRSYRLVAIKSPWDYAAAPDEFSEWLVRVQAATKVVNHPDVVRWNLDKAYLREMADRGVAVCPSLYAHTMDDVKAGIAAFDGNRVVIKPTVSAASANTGLFRAADPAAQSLAARILDLGKVVLIQPGIQSVSEVGERSLVYLDGVFVHAIRKGPLLAEGGGLLRGEYVESITSDIAPADEHVLAGHALSAAGELIRERGLTGSEADLMYARVDIARGEQGPLLMELELVEPSYFLDLAPGAEDRYVDAVVARLNS